jgi:hypothetical protein
MVDSPRLNRDISNIVSMCTALHQFRQAMNSVSISQTHNPGRNLPQADSVTSDVGSISHAERVQQWNLGVPYAIT